MKIYNIKNVENITDKLNKISNDLNIGLNYGFNSLNCIRVKLTRKNNNKYQRTGFMYSDKLNRYNKVNAVCWHGFRDFLKSLYEIDENLRVVTAQTTYTNKENFYSTYEDTRYNNIGSMMQPIELGSACLC